MTAISCYCWLLRFHITLVTKWRWLGLWSDFQGIESILMTSTFCTHFAVPKAVDSVVVNDAHGLHEGVNDRWADEAEAAFLQVLANCL